MSDSPVFSRREVERFQPDGWDRAYLLAPLTFMERQAYRADLARTGGVLPDNATMLAAIRAAIRELGAANEAELLGVVATAEEMPDDPDAQARLAAIEAVVANIPVYAAPRALREQVIGLLPYIAARHALRGWDGPGLPAFRRARGMVPDDLLELVPADELVAVGWRAYALMQPAASAEKNSEAPSPSHETPETSPAA